MKHPTPSSPDVSRIYIMGTRQLIKIHIHFFFVNIYYSIEYTQTPKQVFIDHTNIYHHII